MTLAAFAFPLVRPLIHALEAERAHGVSVAVMKALPRGRPAVPGLLAVSAFGLDFPNPLGLAAGFDKNAEVPDAMLGEGFGFVEVGTVTPKPQAGNPQPRLFRLKQDGAVINRMGFNNEGHAAALARLQARAGRPGIVGVNIGANKDATDRMADYVAGIEAFSGVASYLTVNISSPNTPGLRALQSRAELQELLDRLNAARAKQARKPPMLLKIAPDLRPDELEDVAHCCGGGAVDGIIVSNTTLSRDGLTSPLKTEQGGMSGRPLFELSTRQLARVFVLTGGGIPLVGAGGIDGPEAAWRKIEAGASLLQLYTAMVYRGPALVGDILSGLEAKLRAEGASTLGAIRGRAAARLTRD